MSIVPPPIWDERMRKARERFAGLDAVNWPQLRHAYGPAADAPDWICALASHNAEVRSEAVYHFLLSCAYHQGTLYSATPHVVPFVIQALRDPEIANTPVDSGKLLMKQELLNFLKACARVSQPNDPVGSAIILGRDVYAMCAADEQKITRRCAEELLEFCDGAK